MSEEIGHLLNVKEVARLLTVSVRKVWRDVAAGMFPKPINENRMFLPSFFGYAFGQCQKGFLEQSARQHEMGKVVASAGRLYRQSFAGRFNLRGVCLGFVLARG